MPIISVKDFVRKRSVVKFKRNGGTIKLPSGTIMRFVEKFGVYFICLNVISGSVDGCDSSVLVDAIVDSDNRQSIHAIDRATEVLGPRNSTDDAPPRNVSFDLPPPCSDDHCRDRCCRRGLVKRPGRLSSFTRPAP